jgi:hypothetical protein
MSSRDHTGLASDRIICLQRCEKINPWRPNPSDGPWRSGWVVVEAVLMERVNFPRRLCARCDCFAWLPITERGVEDAQPISGRRWRRRGESLCTLSRTTKRSDLATFKRLELVWARSRESNGLGAPGGRIAGAFCPPKDAVPKFFVVLRRVVRYRRDAPIAPVRFYSRCFSRRERMKAAFANSPREVQPLEKIAHRRVFGAISEKHDDMPVEQIADEAGCPGVREIGRPKSPLLSTSPSGFAE